MDIKTPVEQSVNVSDVSKFLTGQAVTSKDLVMECDLCPGMELFTSSSIKSLHCSLG